MTKFEEFHHFENSIRAQWKKPHYSPMKWEIIATCKYECNDQIYLVNKTVLLPIETTLTFFGLASGSQCDFTLKAVYNPASIDEGISVPYMILPASS